MKLKKKLEDINLKFFRHLVTQYLPHFVELIESCVCIRINTLNFKLFFI